VLLAPAALSLAGFLLLALCAQHTQFFRLDHDTRALVTLTRDPLLDHAMRSVSALGDNTGLIPLILAGSALLWRMRWRWAIGLPLAMIGTWALQSLAKWAVDRPRPNELPWGFPSGHVLSVVVYFGLVAYVLAASGVGRGWRRAGTAAGAAAVVAVAFSRLYLEAHWLSDVAGGFMLGLAYLLSIIWVTEIAAGPTPACRPVPASELPAPAET
jgi:undecaprenyl-diphosphatase